MQQVGNAIGVAVIGVVFFGAVGGHGFGGAFELSLGVLAATLIGVVALTRLLPAGRPGEAATERIDTPVAEIAAQVAS
jgi:hypothetical protein